MRGNQNSKTGTWLVLFFVLLMLVADLVTATDDFGVIADKGRLITLAVSVLIATILEDIGVAEPRPMAMPGHSSAHRTRERKRVSDIFNELGPYYVRRAYRMTSSDFWALLSIVEPYIVVPKSPRKKHKNGAKNGLITPEIRLSSALRYFAGGRPEDIALVHGISHTEVFNSVWMIVDAVNTAPELAFSFPEDHEKQKELARGFLSKCKGPRFDTCIAAIDGMLLWTERPTEAMCELAKCGPRKFFCGRKHKYGLNLQGVCDYESRFLEVSIFHPASVADFLAFQKMQLYHNLETVPDYLAEGLCIFGDAAYVNNRHFATPFKSVSAGPRDAYNYFHSSVRKRT